MDLNTLQSILTIGETVAIEFKRCGNGIESDTYETVCSFLNRFGGDIFMGILDDGTVLGVPEKSAPDLVKNFISVIGNPSVFSPTVYLSPEILKDKAGRTIIHVHIPPSAEVHSYKKIIYDRVDDADVKVTATSQIAAMYIRKQNIFTERKIYPYVSLEDFRLDLLSKVRIMAVNNAQGNHPWKDMSDEQLLKSAGLYGFDRMTGQQGFNLASVMLLGKEDVILNVVPAYVTDALVRKVNVDRYDDREIITTNLIESYGKLMEFARKHLPDKFFLEDDLRKSLRNIIAREMLVNTLIHRELTSSFRAKFVIEKDKMYVENANRAVGEGIITPENLEPNPKNPVIASFFRNIGYSDQLGSGVRNLFKYTKFYSGKEPEFKEGDIFRITVPLDEDYSFDFSEHQVRMTVGEAGETEKESAATKKETNATKKETNATKKETNATKK
ncbi:MAG: putative DNA binding domain-containing protein, partial [Eubacterium sp.]|nr:putative DNA binding domain-containing protein [Eubacterium sp.]